MAVSLDDFKNHINADDDEDVKIYLTNAKNYVDLYVQGIENQFFGERKTDYDSMIDTAVLELATSLYLHRDGAPVTSGTQSVASLDMVINYGRNFSI